MLSMVASSAKLPVETAVASRPRDLDATNLLGIVGLRDANKVVERTLTRLMVPFARGTPKVKATRTSDPVSAIKALSTNNNSSNNSSSASDLGVAHYPTKTIPRSQQLHPAPGLQRKTCAALAFLRATHTSAGTLLRSPFSSSALSSTPTPSEVDLRLDRLPLRPSNPFRRDGRRALAPAHPTRGQNEEG
jgi:hypothetical protein